MSNISKTQAPFKGACVFVRGLRDDFRTMDWVAVVGDLGLSYNLNKLESLLKFKEKIDT